MPAFPSAEGRMWELIQQYTNRVGYRRGAKASSLGDDPPVIDCSGWVALMLTEAMKAQNTDAGEEIFDIACFDIPDPWSDGIIVQIEACTPVLPEGRDITADSLPRNATIGLDEGYAAWQDNHPRLRGINHITQVVRRPNDQAPFISESYSTGRAGVQLTPLDDWLDGHAHDIQTGKAWAVDPFAMADPLSSWVTRARGA